MLIAQAQQQRDELNLTCSKLRHALSLAEDRAHQDAAAQRT